MTRYLQVSKDKMISKGIESIRSRVVNLSEYNKQLDIPMMTQTLIDSFQGVYGDTSDIQDGEGKMDQIALDELHNKYKSWEWRFGESPKFDLELNTRFSWGGIDLGLSLENGKIKKAHVYSDAMDESFIDMIPVALEGCLFHSKNMSEKIMKIPTNSVGQREIMTRDIAKWIRDKGF